MERNASITGPRICKLYVLIIYLYVLLVTAQQLYLSPIKIVAFFAIHLIVAVFIFLDGMELRLEMQIYACRAQGFDEVLNNKTEKSKSEPLSSARLIQGQGIEKSCNTTAKTALPNPGLAPDYSSKVGRSTGQITTAGTRSRTG
jgi:hypothetical protein